MNVKSRRFKRFLIKPSSNLFVMSALLLLALPLLGNWILTRLQQQIRPTDPQFETAHEGMLKISEQTSGHASVLGGLNEYGISQIDYDAWRQLNGKPIADLSNIQPDEVKAIYYEHWQSGGCKRYDLPLTVACLDTMLSFGKAQSQGLFANLPTDSKQAALEVASRRELLRRRQQRPPLTPGKQLTLREGLKRDRALADWIVSVNDTPPPVATKPFSIPIPNFSFNQKPANPEPSTSAAGEADKIYQQLKPVTVEIWNNSQRGIATAASGIILTADGLVLTNHHVIETNPSPSVKLADGRKFEAEIVSIDPSLDLALIQLKDASNLPVTPLAKDSTQVKEGDTVYAIGSPLGESWKMTTSQVIELNSPCANGASPLRCIRTPGGFLQPGNSGGPLINTSGEVIGLNRAVQQSTGEGVSIPVETIEDFLSQRVGKPEQIQKNERWL